MIENKGAVRVACDGGYAETNIIAYSEAGELVVELSIPSRARSGVHGTTSIGNKETSIHNCYETDSSLFTVGDFKDCESTRFDGYHYSGLNRAIVAHALRVAGYGGSPIHLASGLPMSIFYKGGQRNMEAINKKTASLSSKISATDGSKMAEIVTSRVFPEGLSAYIDYVIDCKGNYVGDTSKSVGIVDIGGRTTDFAVVMACGENSNLDHARSKSENIGVLDLVESLSIAINKEFKANVAEYIVTNALKTKTIKLWGVEHDISKLIDASSKSVLERILREIQRCFGDAVDLDEILLVGGGANVFGDAAKTYPNIMIPDKPEFANARGFAKSLLL